MDHPEVRAWLEEAVLQPVGLEHPPDLVADHLERCRGCAAERDALRATAVVLDFAIGPSQGARRRVLANVHQLGREPIGQTGREPRHQPAPGVAPVPLPARVTASGWLERLTPRLAAAMLALAVLLFGAGALSGLLLRGAGDEPARLPNVVAQMSDLAAAPDASYVTLRDAGGTAVGVVVHSPTTHRLAVISGPLPLVPEPGYWCYLERQGQRIAIGPMHQEEDMYFWAGPMGGPGDAGRPGDRFVVMAEGSDDPPVLVGEF